MACMEQIESCVGAAMPNMLTLELLSKIGASVEMLWWLD